MKICGNKRSLGYHHTDDTKQKISNSMKLLKNKNNLISITGQTGILPAPEVSKIG